MTSVRQAVGAWGERVAAQHLVTAGYQVVARNWRCSIGEVDIVAWQADVLVFCEVKTRRGTGYGHPVEAVTRAKQVRLRTLAQRWLAAHAEHAPSLRFDVVGVLLRGDGPAVVTHLPGAFT